MEKENEQQMLPIGTLLNNGKYRIEQYIASGGFGNTYKATDTAFDEVVAIKEFFIKKTCNRESNSTVVSISITDNRRQFEAQQEKFRKEARRMRKLVSDHIVRVHDLFDENGTSYYVMDFIQGESLSARMKRTKRPLSEADVMAILPQLLDALEVVHKECIWHLDLKPGNIMIDEAGKIQLIDFGASKQTQNTKGEAISTSSSLAYTPGFTPAEQKDLLFDKFGPWTDLYALGATIFNLLTDKRPPMQSEIDESVQSAFKPIEGISQRIYDLVVWMMKTNRTMRPQSVAAVRTFLEESSAPSKPKSREEKKPEGKDDTVLKPGRSDGKNTSGGGAAGEMPDDVSKKEKSSSGALKYAAIGVVAGVIALAGILMFAGRSSGDAVEEEVMEIATVDSAYTVTDSLIEINEGAPNMRKYTYSGDVDAKNHLPNGIGTARYEPTGDIPGAVYHGAFSMGVAHDESGDAELQFDNGDKFKGSFDGGYYKEGQYTLRSGEYFIGTFNQGNLYTGKWYSADGVMTSEIFEGKEK